MSAEAAAVVPVYDVEFFFDPVCPWAWLTSRWVCEVASQRDLTVDWRFISLRLLNSHKDYAKDFPPGYPEGHGSGLKLLRVAAAIRETGDRDRMGDLYTQFAGDIHVRGRRSEMVDNFEAGFPEYLRSVGIEEEFIAAANDPKWDEILQAETDEALSRTGKDVGTPIISFTRDGKTYSLESFMGRADTLAKLETLWGDAKVANQIPGWIDAVTSEDVQRTARTYLTKANRTVIDRKPAPPAAAAAAPAAGDKK